MLEVRKRSNYTDNYFHVKSSILFPNRSFSDAARRVLARDGHARSDCGDATDRMSTLVAQRRLLERHVLVRPSASMALVWT